MLIKSENIVDNPKLKWHISIILSLNISCYISHKVKMMAGQPAIYADSSYFSEPFTNSSLVISDSANVIWTTKFEHFCTASITILTYNANDCSLSFTFKFQPRTVNYKCAKYRL